jgi:hypothetical protein
MDKFRKLKRLAEKCPIKRFKPFIGKANTQATLCADTGIEVIGWSGFDSSDLNTKSHRVELVRFIAAADPETILALLVELESKDKHIAELEVKLATPVRVPERWDISGQVNPPRIVQVQFEQQNRTLVQCADAIRAAGFTVGDE